MCGRSRSRVDDVGHLPVAPGLLCAAALVSGRRCHRGRVSRARHQNRAGCSLAEPGLGHGQYRNVRGSGRGGDDPERCPSRDFVEPQGHGLHVFEVVDEEHGIPSSHRAAQRRFHVGRSLEVGLQRACDGQRRVHVPARATCHDHYGSHAHFFLRPRLRLTGFASTTSSW